MKATKEFRNELGDLYVEMEVNFDGRYLYSSWQGGFITLEELVTAGNYVLDLCEYFNLQHIINDNRKLTGSWDHANDYNANVWLPRALKIGLLKLAHISSPEIFAQLSGEQMEQYLGGDLNIKIFKDFEDFQVSCNKTPILQNSDASPRWFFTSW